MYRTTEFLHVKHVEMGWNEVEALLTQGLDNLLTLTKNMGHTWAWDQKFLESEILQAYGLDLKGDCHVPR
jgi:hypothetical protein